MGLVHHLTEKEVSEAGYAAERAIELAPDSFMPNLLLGFFSGYRSARDGLKTTMRIRRVVSS